MKAFIFIDTNIMLDFYRVRGREGGLSILDQVDANHDRIITSAQVEMEYKKNRQSAILEAIKSLKSPDWASLTLPAFLADSRPKKNIEKSRSTIDAARKKAVSRIEKLLRHPARNDPVYKVLQRLFRNDSAVNLSRKVRDRFRIRRLALKRFLLGYPPRKAADTSYGDAVNWEWIIYCANRNPDEIIIVSRDSDYGVIQNDESFLNDWLREEFKQRVSKKRAITLTARLTDAFKRAKITVSASDEAAEREVIQEKQSAPSNRATQTVEEVLEELRGRWPPAFHEPRM